MERGLCGPKEPLVHLVKFGQNRNFSGAQILLGPSKRISRNSNTGWQWIVPQDPHQPIQMKRGQLNVNCVTCSNVKKLWLDSTLEWIGSKRVTEILHFPMPDLLLGGKLAESHIC